MHLHIQVALICFFFSEDILNKFQISSVLEFPNGVRLGNFSDEEDQDNGDEGESSSDSADEDEKNKADTVGNHLTLY